MTALNIPKVFSLSLDLYTYRPILATFRLKSLKITVCEDDQYRNKNIKTNNHLDQTCKEKMGSSDEGKGDTCPELLKSKDKCTVNGSKSTYQCSGVEEKWWHGRATSIRKHL